jgi:uncharacterized protein YidB (DUF937 family)
MAMMRLMLAFAAITAMGAVHAHADTPICGIPFKSPAQVEAEVSKAKGAIVIKGNDYVHGYSNSQSSVGWIFTSKKSAAHPAVVCRWQSSKNNKPVFLTDIRCGGKKDACNKLAAEYRRLDQLAEAVIKRVDEQAAKNKKKKLKK